METCNLSFIDFITKFSLLYKPSQWVPCLLRVNPSLHWQTPGSPGLEHTFTQTPLLSSQPVQNNACLREWNRKLKHMKWKTIKFTWRQRRWLIERMHHLQGNRSFCHWFDVNVQWLSTSVLVQPLHHMWPGISVVKMLQEKWHCKWRRPNRQDNIYDIFHSFFSQNEKVCASSLKRQVHDVEDLSTVVTGGDGALSLQTKLSPEQPPVLVVNGQCFELLCWREQSHYDPTPLIRPLDTGDHPKRKPKQKPANIGFHWRKTLLMCF